MNEKEYKKCLEILNQMREETIKEEAHKKVGYKKPTYYPRYCMFADMCVGDVFELRGKKYVKLRDFTEGVSHKNQPSTALCLDNLHYVTFAQKFKIACKVLKSITDVK